MTMLDRMRRHKAWLKWSLALVVLTFVVFYIPDFLQPAATTGATGREVVADVNGDELYAAEFRNRYAQQMQAYRAQLGGSKRGKRAEEFSYRGSRCGDDDWGSGFIGHE